MYCMQCFLKSKYIKNRTFNDKNRWIIKKVMVFKKLLQHLATRGTYSPGHWRCDEAWREQTLVYPPVMCQQRLIYCTWEFNVMMYTVPSIWFHGLQWDIRGESLVTICLLHQLCCAPVKYTTPFRGTGFRRDLFFPRWPEDLLVVLTRTASMIYPLLASIDCKDSSIASVAEYRLPLVEAGWRGAQRPP